MRKSEILVIGLEDTDVVDSNDKGNRENYAESSAKNSKASFFSDFAIQFIYLFLIYPTYGHSYPLLDLISLIFGNITIYQVSHNGNFGCMGLLAWLGL